LNPLIDALSNHTNKRRRKMKSKVAVMMVVLTSIALLFGNAIAGGIPADTVRSNDINFWEEVGWSDMTPAEQALWMKLGWNADSWEGEAKQPASEDKYWKQLSAEEQAAATALGYTKATWDAE
jgi:hypothetical protein